MANSLIDFPTKPIQSLRITNTIRRTIFVALKQLELERSIKVNVHLDITKQHAKNTPEWASLQHESDMLQEQHIEVLKAIDWFKRQ